MGQQSTSIDWTLPAIADVVAEAVPDREMIVCGDTRRTFAEVAERSRGLAGYLVQQGIGTHTERDELERWEVGQDAVAMVLHNCAEYLEAQLGCFRARAVPFNVNHHYRATEVRGLFEVVRPRAILLHRSYAPLIDEALAGLPFDPSSTGEGVQIIVVEDGSDVPHPVDSIPYEQAVAAGAGIELPEPSPDDLYMVCTGGTTGPPKAVLWRQADIYLAAMGRAELITADDIAQAAVDGGGSWFPTAPLMHAAAQWTAYSAFHVGSTVVLLDGSEPFSAQRLLEVAESEQVVMVSIVGDAFARPLVEELDRKSYDLSNLFIFGTGGAATSEHLKDALLEHVPNMMIIDGYGASETGGMAFVAKTKGEPTPGFTPSGGAIVISADRTTHLEPGSDEIGWTARVGRVPLGYLGDQTKTEETFPVVDGERLSVPGDRAKLADDGSIVMLGRDSMVVNTGGEKVFVEEVEEVLRADDRIADALVVGRPSDRFGQEVVAIVELAPTPAGGSALSAADIREIVASTLARFKAPRAVLVVDRVERYANGKANYTWAKEVAADAVDAG